MLHTLFMFWVVASISVVVASMVIGGLVCVWCAFIGRRRFRRNGASLSAHRPPSPSLSHLDDLYTLRSQLAHRRGKPKNRAQL